MSSITVSSSISGISLGTSTARWVTQGENDDNLPSSWSRSRAKEAKLEDVIDEAGIGAEVKREELRNRSAGRMEGGIKRPRDRVDAAETGILMPPL